MAVQDLPDILKHNTIAIYRKPDIAATSLKDKFQQCLAIARARLAEYGFLVPLGEEIYDPVALTQKGIIAEMRHNREGREKTVLFDTLFRQYDIDGSRKREAEERDKKRRKQIKEGQEDD